MRFEVLYLAVAPITLVLLAQFAVLMWMHRNFRPLYYVLGMPFVVQNVFYNVTIGSLLFRELPREWLFTTRLKRWEVLGDPRVDRFALALNRLDPGHV